MTTALIVGVTGQDGAYLARLLVDKGYRVVGTTRRSALNQAPLLEGVGVREKVELVDLDLADASNVTRVVQAAEAEEIYNLAGHSFVPLSWDQPQAVADVNAMGVLRLLEAIRTFSPTSRFYQASSSELFGMVSHSPQDENTPVRPRSPYGVAKAYGHHITVSYRESFDLHASSGILFNHESPLRGAEFVTRKITSGLAAIKAGSDQPVQLGNLDARRDWGFAGDYVEGMWRMLQQPTAGDYVLATGVTTSIREFVEHAANALGFRCEWSGAGLDEVAHDTVSSRKLVEVDPRFYRPTEDQQLVGDASKAASELGWHASTTVEQLAAMMARADFAGLGQ